MSELLFVKKYCVIEGFAFWHKYAIIGKLPIIKQHFWETYPEIKNPTQIFKNGTIVKMKNKRYLIKITPKIDFYISNDYYIPTAEEMAKKFIDFKMNKKIFFTLKGYSEFLEEKVNALNMFHYNQFTFQPQEDEILYFRIFPSLMLADRSKHLARSAILTDQTDALAIRNPPIRVASFLTMPEFKKKEIIKNWIGLQSLEPTNEYKKKLAIPLFLNPNYVLLEYCPYFDDENTHLRRLKHFFKKFDKDWNLYKNDVIDLVNKIDYWIDQPERKRSKLDFLVDYIRVFKKKIYHPRIIRKIYGYVVITRKFKTKNGLYMIRRNGKIEQMIYFLQFGSIEFWLMESMEGYLDVQKLFNFRQKNLYYFSSLKRKNFRIRDKFLLVKKTQNCYRLQPNNVKSGVKLKKIDILKLKKPYSVVKKVYFLRKRYYHSDNIVMDIRFETQMLVGTVRPKGEKIIYVIKT